MSRYIDADKVMEEINRIGGHNLCDWETIGVKALIERQPSADVVEVRHGEWGFDGLGWTCSECGEYALANKAKLQVHSDYCPHCGAKMDGERRDQNEG